MVVVLVGILAVIAFFGLSIAGWVIGSYNTFVVAMQDLKTQWSNIKTEYQRRADLIMNLVESVKGYARHEKETLKAVIEARSGNFGKTKADEIKNLKGLDKTLNRLMLVFEQYPNLKADTQFTHLNEELVETENRINIARTDYNTTVRSYNVLIKMFPKNILANMFNFRAEDFFEAEEGAEKAPKISFEPKQKAQSNIPKKVKKTPNKKRK